MIELGSDFFIGIGNQPAGTNGALIARVDSDGNLFAEHELDEQGVHDMHLHDGKLYIPGTDPTESWAFGNLYIREIDGTWIKRRTLPNVIHAWGLCHDDSDNLWVATGAHAGDLTTLQGRVMRSTDDGLTWDQNILINDYRVFDIIFQDGLFYAIGYQYDLETILYTSVNGIDWSIVDGFPPYRYQRFIMFENFIVCAKDSLIGLLLIDQDNVSIVSLPFNLPYNLLNCLTSGGEYLYCLDGSGYVWKSSGTLENWEKISFVSGAISIGYWLSQNCLLLSDIGSNARLWKVPL